MVPRQSAKHRNERHKHQDVVLAPIVSALQGVAFVVLFVIDVDVAPVALVNDLGPAETMLCSDDEETRNRC